jgi:hypothetical protein
MAKVEGPLFSMSASGKIGDAMVFFGWKGLNVVRSYVIPSNPQSSDQGDQRVILGGTGRAVGKIEAGEDFAQQLIDLGKVPNGQTKQSFLVRHIVQSYLGSAALYAAELEAVTSHTAYEAFQDGADDLGISEFDLDYASIDPYDKALGLYLIAKIGIALGLEGTPYTTNITEWVTADVEGLVEDMKGV